MSTDNLKRPGIISFAGVLMILLGFFELVSAIELFREASWAKDMSGGIFGDQIVIWAVIDLVVGLAALYAGYSIFKGGNFGRLAGLILASISAIRWFWMIPFQPFMGLTIIFIDVMIIYGLMQHPEWFDRGS
ncbi:MAG TPA: hypothetical protein VFI27_10910 [candidate division Zixibacteria bacterium]|nr:hypothetical protein [candidate division Zixibacteria bacterium]